MLPQPFHVLKRHLLAAAASLEQRVMASFMLRYALAPVFIGLAVLIFHSPAGPAFSLAGLFVLAVLFTAWLGGAGPGLLAAVLGNFAILQLSAVPYPLVWGFIDGPRFLTFCVVGFAVGWRSSSLARVLRDHERHALAMAASEDGFWDWLVADDSIYVSPRWLEIYGLPSGSTFTGRADLIKRIPFHPDDRQRLIQGFTEHFAGTGSRYGAEARFVRNGQTRWIQIAGLATRDAAGKLVRWTGTVRDITERKQSEEALRESEQRYELAMAASESGYWDWHIPSNTYFVSPRAFELAGYPKGTTWATRDDYRTNINMHPEDFAKWEAARVALFAGAGERLAMEVRYMTPNGVRWHKLQAICRRDETGRVVRWTGSATDTTAQRQAEDELRTLERKLRQAQRLESMGTLSGGIAHDFNNILGAILGYGEMALRDALPGTRLARDIDSILVAGERGRALVERLLAFSRSGAGERVPVHVEKVVREVLDLVSAKLPASVKVHASLQAGTAAVLGDATQVHQVVANLATNAMQALADGGTLRVALTVEGVATSKSGTIGTKEPGEYVVLTVSDTGGGISPEIIDRIFDPFFTTKDVGRGTGLGLSLVHGIVTELGGAIDVSSTPGVGSTFVVHLPRAGDAVVPGGEGEAPPPRGDGQCVLVVDDEDALMQLATRTLHELGYRPVGFTSSTQALHEFRADPERFDALLTDERMPELSGSALIREVRKTRGSMPIVLMSGFLGSAGARVPEDRALNGGRRAVDASAMTGADEILQKPISGRELANTMARVLRR